MARVPADAVDHHERTRTLNGDPDDALLGWNRSWVRACLRHAETTVPLRSSKGFLRRRAEGDSLVTFVCVTVSPLLAACRLPLDTALAVWNVVSDPREVVDLRRTLGWSAERIARHITKLTLATHG